MLGLELGAQLRIQESEQLGGGLEVRGLQDQVDDQAEELVDVFMRVAHTEEVQGRCLEEARVNQPCEPQHHPLVLGLSDGVVTLDGEVARELPVALWDSLATTEPY